MIRAVIFDIDGTLLNSKKANREFYKELFKKAGYGPFPDERIDQVFHLTMWDAIRFLTGEPEEKIKKIWDSRFKVRYPSELLKIPDGELETIKKLSQRYRLAIVSGRTKRGVDVFYEATGLKDYFQVVVSFEDYIYPKPNPEPLLVALKKMKVRPEETIYVGDSQVDLEAARAAGMKFIGFYLYAVEKIKSADANIKSFRALPGAIQRLGKLDKKCRSAKFVSK